MESFLLRRNNNEEIGKIRSTGAAKDVANHQEASENQSFMEMRLKKRTLKKALFLVNNKLRTMI